MKQASLIAIILLVAVGSQASSESTVAASSSTLVDVTTAAKRLETRPIDEPAESISLAWDYALSKQDSGTAVCGIVSLWKKQKRSLVELVWWRQSDPRARRSALLLFFALTKVEADTFPDFESFAARFEPTEAASRKQEITEVKAMAEASRDALLKALGIQK